MTDRRCSATRLRFSTRVLATLLLVLAAALSAQAADGADEARFDGTAAMRHIARLSLGIGVRRGGSAAERAAAAYVIEQMRAVGYEVERQAVPLPYGRRSENLIFVKPGSSDSEIVVGAHLDSKPPSPGANDNASGVATLIEMARALRSVPLAPSIRFVVFGSEEILHGKDDWHHFGSRWYVRTWSAQARRRCIGMICVDSVGGGPRFVIGSTREGSPLARDMRTLARRRGVRVESMIDPGWSDHEPFEKAGVSVAYLRWRVDPTLHTKGDDFDHVDPRKVQTAGDLVLTYLLETSARDGDRPRGSNERP